MCADVGRQELKSSGQYLRGMRVKIFVIFLLASSCAVAQAQTHQERKVRRLLAKGKAYPAIRIASGVLGKNTHPEFYALRAEGYNSISEFTKAEADARTAIRLLPDSVGGLFQLAAAEQGLGRMDSAAVHFRQVLQQRPGVEAHYRLAMVEQMRGDLTGASRQIAQAIAMEEKAAPSSARLHRVKGEVAAMAGDSVLARTELDRAVELDPDDPVNYNSRGYYAHAWRGDHRGAIADYDRAIKLNPNYSYAFNNRGWSEYKNGETAKGIKDIQRARKKKIHNPFVYRNLGVIALETGDTAKACMLLRQALDRDFTALYGDEVEQLMTTSCRGSADGKPMVPVQPSQGTIDRKTEHPVPRTNAPE